MLTTFVSFAGGERANPVCTVMAGTFILCQIKFDDTQLVISIRPDEEHLWDHPNYSKYSICRAVADQISGLKATDVATVITKFILVYHKVQFPGAM